MATARQFVRALAREISLTEASRLIDEDCRLHIRGRSYGFGPESWRNYVNFLWSCGRLENPCGHIDSLTEGPEGLIRVDGIWHATLDGEPVQYPACVSWRIRDGKVVDIYTDPKNYLGFFPIMKSLAGVAIVALRYKLWRRQERPDAPLMEAVS